MTKISKNENISHFDPNQISHLTFDDSRDAMRVTLVDGLKVTADSINFPEMKFPEQKVIEIPVIVKEAEIHQINVPVIIKEIQVIEVPKIITEYKTIEVPVVIREVQVVEIEKPVIVKEIQVIEKLIPTMPKFALGCMLIQTIVNIALLIFLLKGK